MIIIVSEEPPEPLPALLLPPLRAANLHQLHGASLELGFVHCPATSPGCNAAKEVFGGGSLAHEPEALAVDRW